MKFAREESGFALVAAILMLFIMTGLGLGVLQLTDAQQKASSTEQASEAAFNIAEAALNAQIGQLASAWPATEGAAYPTVCTATTTATTNGCPTAASLASAYSNTASASCPGGTGEPWGSPLSKQWTTYVRDNGPVGSPTTLYNSTVERSLPSWDANGDGKVWVRSVGVDGCRFVSVISLASEQLVATSFPESAVVGNWFETSNEGNKIIVNTEGESSQPGSVSMRCTGRTLSNCKEYRSGQVYPDTTGVAASPSPTLTASQLENVKSAAKSAGTYFANGQCPTSLGQVSGNPVYVEGPCEFSATGGTGNSPTRPGFLVFVNGTFKLNGNATFYGTLYAVDQQGSAGVVIELHGNSELVGSIVVDGNGGISFGSSKQNFIYNADAARELKTFAGAAPTRNSFRVLPANQ
jgi:Tfp pilus assembly protein PilX